MLKTKKLKLPVPFMNRKIGGSQMLLLGRWGRKKTQFSSSTIASDPCACTCNHTSKTRKLDSHNCASRCQVQQKQELFPCENILLNKVKEPNWFNNVEQKHKLHIPDSTENDNSFNEIKIIFFSPIAHKCKVRGSNFPVKCTSSHQYTIVS